jgi:hypothetical protein
MSEPNTPNSPETEAQNQRTKRVAAAGWTAGLSDFFNIGALTTNASCPVAVGAVVVAVMVATACYFMLK